MSFKHAITFLLCTIGMVCGSGASEPPAAAGRKFLAAFRDCQSRHDVSACSGLVADNAMIYTDDGDAADKATFLHYVEANAKPNPGAVARRYSGPKDGTGWRTGDLLFFNYRSVWTEMYGEQPFRTEFRATLVLREGASGAQLLLFQATPIPNTQRRPVKIDPRVYDQYVGEYSAGPGDHVVVTREGDELLMTANGGRAQLRPGGRDSFYVSGEADDWSFIRNAGGKVTGLESRLWGQNILAKRLP